MSKNKIYTTESANGSSVLEGQPSQKHIKKIPGKEYEIIFSTNNKSILCLDRWIDSFFQRTLSKDLSDIDKISIILFFGVFLFSFRDHIGHILMPQNDNCIIFRHEPCVT